eukprot:1009735-Rhodomonas_salina.2
MDAISNLGDSYTSTFCRSYHFTQLASRLDGPHGGHLVFFSAALEICKRTREQRDPSAEVRCVRFGSVWLIFVAGKVWVCSESECVESWE